MRTLEKAIINSVETGQLLGYKTLTILPTGKVLKVDTGIQGYILSDTGSSSTKVNKFPTEPNEQILTINRKFAPVFQDNALVINAGGRASGKTTASTVAAILETYKPQQRNVLVLRFNKSSVKDSIYSELVKFIETHELEEDFSIESTQLVNTVTGSKILFKGIKSSSLDVRDSLKGIIDLSYILIEEAADLTDDLDEVLELLRGTMRTQGFFYRIQLVLNPRSKAHPVFKRFFSGLDSPSEYCGEHNSAYLINSSYKDNPFLPEQFIKNTILATKEFNPEVYCHVYGGEWKEIGEGQIIRRFRVGEYREFTPTVVGIDLGFRDETAGLMISVDQDKMEAYVKLVLFGSGLTQDDIIAALVPYQSYKMVLDSARPEIIEAMKRQRFKAVSSKKGAGSVLDGIQLMTSYEIIIDPQNSDKVIDAFTNYVWKTTATEVPNHAYSHIPDSIRYGLSYVCGGNSGTYYLDGETYGGRIDTSDMARTWH